MIPVFSIIFYIRNSGRIIFRGRGKADISALVPDLTLSG